MNISSNDASTICASAILVILLLISFAQHFHPTSTQSAAQSTPSPQALKYLCQTYYLPYCKALCGAVLHVYSGIGLAHPGNSSIPHIVLCPKCIRYLPSKNRPVFFYVFDRATYLNGGLGNSQYSTVSLQTMVGKINTVFPQYCIARGLQPARIFYSQNCSQGRVLFGIIW